MFLFVVEVTAIMDKMDSAKKKRAAFDGSPDPEFLFIAYSKQLLLNNKVENVILRS